MLIPDGIFSTLAHCTVKLFTRAPLPPNVVPINDHKWRGHKCMNFEYWIRDDDMIVCAKCDQPVGYFSPL